MNTADTIAAISTVPAPAARLIVRLSGPLSHAVAGNLVHPILTPVLRHAEEPDIGVVTSGSSAYFRTGVGMKFGAASAVHAMLCFNELRCPAWVYAFRSPHSYTGEDSIEFHLPGSLVLAKLLLDELYRQGVRAAEPGEFTARAFFNGKIGLTEAEGVAATIAAGSEMALRAARQLMAGELSRRLQPIMDSLAHTLALIEVGIDFSEEQVTFLASDQVLAKVLDADQALAELLSDSDRFEQVTHEPRIVFAGRPNAGKSSLINAMVRHHRAVVSDVSGTTRDVLTAELELKRGRVLLTDIAGLDSLTNGSGTTAEIADQMQSKAQNAIDSADHLIEISACTDASPRLDFGRPVDLRVITKSDLDPGGMASDARAIRVSSMTGAGLDRLRDALDELAFGESGGGASLALNRRHLLAISDARAALRRVPTGVSENSPELVAMDLRDALDALGSVVGSVTPDDVLGRIFSMFCIGK